MTPRTRRDWLRFATVGLAGAGWGLTGRADDSPRRTPGASALTITGLKVTPIALPDPPLLAASGCHGPYFLRNVVELTTDGGIEITRVDGERRSRMALKVRRTVVE